MAKINPFRAVRPSKTNLQNFSSKSYKTYSQIELVANLKNNPNSFLSIINLKKNTNFALDIAKRYELAKVSSMLRSRISFEVRDFFYTFIPDEDPKPTSSKAI